MNSKTPLVLLALGGVAAYLVFGRGASAGGAAAPVRPPYDPTRPPTPAERHATMVAVQTALRAEGLYGGALDGVAGPRTRAAVDEWLLKRPAFATRTRAISDPARQEYELLSGILARVPAEV